MRVRRICSYIMLSICTLIVVLCLKPNIAVHAEQKETTIYDFKEVIDGILAWEESENEVQSLDDFIQKSLPEYAGVSPTEWIVVSLLQYDVVDTTDVFSEYQQALDEYVQTMEDAKGTDYQRIAIAYAALDENSDFIQEVIDTKAGSLGIMSYVYALDLMDTRAYTSEVITRDDIVKEILDLQLEDGGWALSGENGDADVTAMTVQSLALYRENEVVKDALEQALNFLSERQTDDGDYKSYGVSNAETTAQVLFALCSMDIDWKTDSRFLKNGNTVCDGLLKYRLADGSFAHIEDGDSNGLASAQAMYALIAAWRQEEGKTSLFRFTDEKLTDIYVAAKTEDNERVHKTEEEDIISNQPSEVKTMIEKIDLSSITGYQIKCILCGLIGLLMLILLLKLVAKKRFHIQNVMPVFLVGILAISYVLCSNIQSSEEYYDTVTTQERNADTINVTLSIQCDAAIGEFDTNYIPEDGMILNQKTVAVSKDSSVFELLKTICQQEKIHLDYYENKMSSGTYVQGIQYLYEYDCGDLSGWMYQVNGTFPNTQSDSYTLEEGDEVRWVYTLNLGKDVGAE